MTCKTIIMLVITVQKIFKYLFKGNSGNISENYPQIPENKFEKKGWILFFKSQYYYPP